MKALSLRQPYGSLVAAGIKPHETRHYPPPARYLGQRIAIHQAQRRLPLIDALELGARHHGDPVAHGVITQMLNRTLPAGAVVCTAVLSGAYRCGETIERRGKVLVEVVERLAGSPCTDSYVPVNRFGAYAAGRWFWSLADVHRLAVPVPCLGRQGWFQVADELLGEVPHA